MPIPWPRQEGTMPKLVMHGSEKSDPLIVPTKSANNVGQPTAESAEGSGGTERNAGLRSMVRTQSREAVSQAQARIREAVNRNKKEKLTALLHHVSVDALRWAFLNLRKEAAPDIDDTTTATSWPASTSRFTWFATLRIRSMLATDVPPNFITRRPMTIGDF